MPADRTPGPGGEGSAYSSAGVDYAALDAGKREALTQALATSALLTARGGRSIDESRGEPAFVFEYGTQTLAFVLEGLGTKAMIAAAAARELREQGLPDEELVASAFANVAYDTVAAIVNDLCCVGALPLVVNAYFATGSSDWYLRADRQAALVDGWRRACVRAGATWGGGESPSLPGLVDADEIELAGSAVGAVPEGHRAILGADLCAGDEIVFVDSTGLHANGSSLARVIAGELDDGYATTLPSGRGFGDALLDPAPVYVPLVAALLEHDVPVHYLSHITGHGLLKLMRPSRDFTYRIAELPAVPEVLGFLVQRAGMSPSAAYSTFNMGVGYAVYTAQGTGERVVELAAEHGFGAHVAGVVEDGPRRVALEPIDVVFETDAMDLTPRRAA